MGNIYECTLLKGCNYSLDSSYLQKNNTKRLFSQTIHSVGNSFFKIKETVSLKFIYKKKYDKDQLTVDKQRKLIGIG